MSVKSRNFTDSRAGAPGPRYCKNSISVAVYAEFTRMQRIISALRWGGLLAVAGALAACGYFGGSQPTTRSAHSATKAHAPQAMGPAAQAMAGMVEAVGGSGSQAPVELRFSIHDRPQVGQDDEVDYALIPQVAGLEAIRVAFTGLSGLTVVNRGPLLVAIKPAIGAPIFGSVAVRPVKAGLFTLTAEVQVQSPSGDSVDWPFTIPVIAGEGPAQTAANQP